MLDDLRKTPFLKILAVAAVYWLAAEIGLLLAIQNTNASPVWPPSGIALAAVLLLGYKVWPGIFLGAFFANAMAFYANHVPLLNAAAISGSIAVGNTLEALLGAFLLQRFAGSQGGLGRVWDVFKFAALAGVLSAMVSATIGVTSVSLAGIAPGVSLQALWWNWWIGDMMGVLLFTPLLLSWRQEAQLVLERQRLPEGLILLALLIATTAVAFGLWSPTGANYPVVYMPLIFLVWAAFRFGQTGALTALFIVSSVAIVGTVHGVGPFAKPDFHESLLLLQTFMGVVSMMVLVLSAALREGKQAEQELRRAHADLEVRVQERTAELARANKELHSEIAERRWVEKALEGAKEAAEVANRAKSRFLANTSHELRTPLNAIINLSEVVLEDARTLDRQDAIEPLERVLRASWHLLALINDVLDLSKIEAGKMELHLESVSIGPLVEDVGKTVRPLAEKNGNRLTVECAKELGTIQADPTRVRQALFNLASNAAKFTEQGTIAIAAERRSDDGSEWIVMSVADTGIGMTPEQVAKLFADFTQADSSSTRKFGGTGLGLAISRRFCRMMGGDITVESVPGRGSTFTIRLPADAAGALGVTASGEATVSAARRAG